MLYDLSKAAHIVSLITWLSGMLAAAMALRHSNVVSLASVRRHDRFVTAPAMLLAWIFGILLAVQAGWFSDTWLWIKLALVVLLSGMHGTLSGKLRRAAQNESEQVSPIPSAILPIGFLLMALIVLLVTTKPF